ncbi:MAG: DNA double-strand break repair nuclease NurA [Promethearchaeota archaeon]
MPLDLSLVYDELQKKKQYFKKFSKELSDEYLILQKNAPKVFSLSYKEILTRISQNPNPSGAIPSKEYKKGLLIPFSKEFSNLPEMIDWAKNFLQNKIVVATDGSQIYTSQEYSIPVALIHVACYRNEHKIGKKYLKKTSIKILTPEELLIEESGRGGKKFSQEPVDCARFRLECELLTQEMDIIDNRKPEIEKAYFIMDGSLILSFIDRFNPKIQEEHLQTLKNAVTKSRKTGYPLIGYVDSSRAKDVVNMVASLSPINLKSINYISDSTVLEKYIKEHLKINMKFGDRTCAFICDRNDPIYKKYPDVLEQRMVFFYIKLNSEQLARVEFPEFLLGNKKEEKEKINEIANILIAESIVGQGYPHLIDQVHHEAVIHAKERSKFYRLFQRFCLDEKLQFRILNKARSKLRR